MSKALSTFIRVFLNLAGKIKFLFDMKSSFKRLISMGDEKGGG